MVIDPNGAATDTDKYVDELEETARTLREAAAQGDSPEMQIPLTALDTTTAAVHKSWSGSNLGYHARTYYTNYGTPPSDDLFDKEWGLMMSGRRERGWTVHDDADDVKQYILQQADISDLQPLHEKSDLARSLLLRAKETVASILTNCQAAHADPYLSGLSDKVGEISAPGAIAFARQYLPRANQMSRDSMAINQGLKVAPHQEMYGEKQAIEAPYLCLRALADHAENAAKHLRRRPSYPPLEVATQIGSRVFIGHGGSPQWRELKDYVQDQLGVPVDEFNRVPAAGYTTIVRLSEMLDSAAMAFLVMTAEDETPDGGFRARQNVIHEVGLFQGRLGFDKAIVMVEEPCEEFSNIHGLTQVRYPHNNISAKFHEVRALLEREGLL